MGDITGIADAVFQLQKLYNFEDGEIVTIVGAEVYDAIMSNNYKYISVQSMIDIADNLGLVFSMGFQSLSVIAAENKETENE
jgi:hypothetical protein